VSVDQPQQQPPGGGDPVRRLELFFDLVYVFAVSQLSHHLLEHPTWPGAAETFVLYVAVFGIWVLTTWSAVVHDINRRPVQGMLLVVMLLGLFMNASIGSAFGGSAWIFVGLYLFTGLGRNRWLLSDNPRPFLRDHYQRLMVWLVVAAVPWILGAAQDEYRLEWWLLAAGIDLAGLVTAHPLPGRKLRSENEQIPRSRLFERARLFFIIAIGETILTTGVAIAAKIDDPVTPLTGTVAFAGSVAVFWAYFDVREAREYAALEAATDPTRLQVHAFNVTFISVGAMIIIAVGDEVVIARPLGNTTFTTVLLLYSGPIIYLIKQLWQSRYGYGRVVRSRLTGIAALLAFAAVSVLLPPFLAAIGAAAPLIGVAVADGRSRMLNGSAQPEPRQAGGG
jgi:low temperature requirement protein LtrA